MPDGRIVVPGGCQPSYPSNVQPATQRGADGMCEKIPCYLKCLPAAAMIATPAGEARVDSLRTGDVVWTVDESGRRVQAPIARIESVPVGADATVVEIALADGRITRASAGHPIASGTTVGQLSIGDTLDGALVSSRREIPYAGDHTWDLLPVGSTGLYWADGVLLGSTLMPKRGR